MRFSETTELALFRCYARLYHQDRPAFNRAYEHEEETGRAYGNASPIRDDPDFPSEQIEWTNHRVQRRLAFIIERVEEYWINLPTLLRWQEEPLHALAVEASRTRRQGEVRVWAGNAVLLRCAARETASVPMSWDSAAKAIQRGTGLAPSPATVKETFAWLGSSAAPFTIMSRGERGTFGRSTVIRVDIPWMEHSTWSAAGTEHEQTLTAEWLATNRHVLDEIDRDETTRRKTLADRKGAYALRLDTERRAFSVELDRMIREGDRTLLRFPGDR